MPDNSREEETPTPASPPRTRSERAGVTFSVGRLHRHLRRGGYAERIGGGAPVFLAAVIQYLTAEVLELAGNSAVAGRARRIKPRHIAQALQNDAELNQLFGNATIPSGGVTPNIHPELLPGSRERRSREGRRRGRRSRERDS